jgi:hypothetical protein
MSVPVGPIDWVPSSCSLPTEDRPLRVAEFDALFAAHLRDVSRISDTAVELVLVGGDPVADTARDLADQETACCSFFTFAVRAEGQTVRVRVDVPPNQADVLTALADRAVAAMGA